MALPISVPYSFANATTSIPLSQLDTDISTVYAAVNGIGNGTVALSNVAITGGNGTFTTITSPASTNLTIQSASTTALTIDTSQNVTAVGTVAMASSFKRNRIINGNMLIDQRNAGASVSASDAAYQLDRWKTYKSGAGTFTVQQSSTAPTGFTKSVLLTVTASSTPGAGDYYNYLQMIEGYNVADFGWGTASAQTITISGQVRSSITGTYSVFILNGSANRCYIGTFTISAANTFTPFSITVAGDTTGTWATDNTNGMFVGFDLGSGSTRTAASGSWQAGLYQHATGSTNWIANSGATFYITGVQLEVGTKATPYEMQIYSDQLAQCQRYYYQGFFLAGIWGGTAIQALLSTPVPMRTTPTTGITGTGYLQFTDTVNPGVTQSVAGWGLTSPVAQNLLANYQTFFWAAGNFAGLTGYRMYYQADYSGGTNNLATLSAEL